MAKSRIVFDGVWKLFRRGPAHDSIRDLIPAVARGLLKRGGNRDADSSHFWALRDVSFEVNPGECIGIVGGNGAGKSTALKLLTHILQPTRGRSEIHGRVGALIEVSAGFHPDLTGRENVFLQGAIMGMPMALIKEQFDAIVDFSGIEAFIDTPVKRYSSGMNARLGFAIAVHLEPEALIIDEVLSVGDASFQRKAFDKVKQLVAREIPTVLVTHQVDRVVDLCSHAIMLDRGVIATQGDPATVVAEYLGGAMADTSGFADDSNCPIRVLKLEQDDSEPVQSGAQKEVQITVDVRDEPNLRQNYVIGLDLKGVESGRKLFAAGLATMTGWQIVPGVHTITVPLILPVAPGVYSLDSYVWDMAGNTMAAHGPSLRISVVHGVEFIGEINIMPTRAIVAEEIPA